MNKNPLFSIIVPAYNAQATIKRTLQSLNNQTYRNHEVIVVNDGSSDDTPLILEEFTGSSGSSCKVIHQVNAGVSAARNRGLREASGEFVLFLDADDWVDDNFLMTFIQSFTKWPAEPVDLIAGNLNNKRVKKMSQAGFFSHREIPYVLGELEISDNIGYLHNKCYRRQIIDDLNLLFPENISMSEDLLFNLKFLSGISNFIVMPDAAYHYEDVEDSLSKRKVQYDELKFRRDCITLLYDTIIKKYQSCDLSNFSKGISKRMLTLDMQIVTSMYYAAFPPGDISREINEIKKRSYSKDILILLNKNEKLKYIIMNTNAFTAYYFLYALYRMRAF